MFADRLVSSKEMPAKPDLASHTLISFLDRFVYRNAKAATGGLRGSSIMQPLAGGDSRGVLVSNRATAKGHESLNSESFWRKKAEDVAVDEVFFHKYFSQIGKTKHAALKKKAGAKSKSDAASENGEDEDEDEIWQALVDSRPEVEGHSDGDSDLDMLDLDDSDDDASSGSDGGVIFNDEDDVDVEGSDEEGSIGSEEPSAFLDDGDMSDEDEDEDELFKKELETNKKPEPKEEDENSRKAKRRKMKNLPMFASMEDYAEMIGGDEDEDLG
jgi:ribosome biogenesis protein MAK21